MTTFAQGATNVKARRMTCLTGSMSGRTELGSWVDRKRFRSGWSRRLLMIMGKYFGGASPLGRRVRCRLYWLSIMGRCGIVRGSLRRLLRTSSMYVYFLLFWKC